MLKEAAGLHLKHARWAKGLTIRGLAELAGISTATIVKVEKDRKDVDGKSIYALAKALDVDVADLFEDVPA